MSLYETFQFLPRPEAKVMQWEQLVQPVQSAVRDLLVILAGSVRQSHGKDKNLEVASCFLVNGERGTGKTSVLLNARKAVEDYESFFIAPIRGSMELELANELNKKLLVRLVPIKEKVSSSEEKQQYAILPESILDGSYHVQPERSNAHEVEAFECAQTIKENAIWLDILDLEPLQAETNLLTTVLTRIRNALTQFEGQGLDGRQELTSLFEANPDSARPLLEGLIGDATLMWENIKEQDTRNIANRQVAAAGIYAGFKERFRKAMDKLAEELGRPYGKDARRSIILPIDNIDRSTEHLHNIVKLAQLVSHRYLWLVMAGGREDISTFLERAYWKELIRNSNAPSAYGAYGRNESNGEDESLTMARRQAAAMAQKIWPSSHRVVVALMKPEDTLAFVPPGQQNPETIEDLLCKVNVQTWLKCEGEPIQLPFFSLFEHLGVPFDISDLKNNESKTSLIKCLKDSKYGEIRNDIKMKLLADLRTKVDAFDEKNPGSKKESDEIAASIIDELNKILATELNLYGNNSSSKIDGVKLRTWIKKECEKHELNERDRWPVRFLNKAILQDVFSGVFSRPLSLAAQNGLRMPARSVVELWQTANWVAHDKTYFDANNRDKAEQIIRTMLRNAIEESSLSSRISRNLQGNVIRNCVNGGTLLNFRKLKLDVECSAPNDTEIRLKQKPKRLNEQLQSCIRVKRGNESFLRFKIKEESHKKDEKDFEEELPEFVAAWLSILYDVLGLVERLAVLRGGTSIPPPKMATQHTVVMHIQEDDKQARYTAIEGELQWPAPAWSTFRAQGLFWRRWKNFQLKVELEWQSWNDYIVNNPDKTIPTEATSDNKSSTSDNTLLDISEVISRYLVIGWIRCILDTFADMHWQSDDCDRWDKILETLPNNLDRLQTNEGIIALGTAVFAQAAMVHSHLTNCMRSPIKQRKHFDIQEMLDWLENDLPMFFSHWYLPIDNIISSNKDRPRFEKYMAILDNPDNLTIEKIKEIKEKLGCGLALEDFKTKVHEGAASSRQMKDDFQSKILLKVAENAKDLSTSWKGRRAFILAAMEDRVAQLFTPKDGMTDKERELRQKEHQYFLEKINQLCSLYTYPNNNPPQNKAKENSGSANGSGTHKTAKAKKAATTPSPSVPRKTRNEKAKQGE